MAPLLPFFLAYLGGILSVLPASNSFLFPWFLPLSAVACGLALYRRARGRRWFGWVFLALIYGCGLSAPGWAAFRQPENQVLRHLREELPADAVGKVSQPPAVFPGRTRYIVDLVSLQYGETAVPVTGLAQITLFSPGAPLENSFRLGDVLRFKKIRLKRPRNFKNPGRFDYAGYMEFLGISVIGSVSRPELVERAGSFAPSRFISIREDVKSAMFRVIDKRLSAEEGALLKGMLLGETKSLSESFKEAYLATGLTHLLAVSGLNLGFVGGAAYFLLYPVVFFFMGGYFPGAARAGYAPRATAFLVLFPVLFYMALVGAQISAIRAGIMVIVFLLSMLLRREQNLFNTLLVSAFLILLWQPRAIESVSFQLSFSAVLSILFAMRYVAKMPADPVDRLGEDKRVSRYLNYFKETAIVSFAAGLGTLPLLIWHFNRVSWIGFFLNVVLTPLAGIVTPLGLLILSIGLVWEDLAGLFMPLCSILLKAFVWIPPPFAALPHASVYVPTPPQIWFVLYYAVLFGVPYWLYANRKPASAGPGARPAAPGRNQLPLLAGLAVAAAWVAVWFVWPRFPQGPSDTLSIYILDVGQGESVFVEFPNRQVLMVDGGGFYKNSFDVGRAAVAPFLWSRGVDRIDYMAATHSDNDHIGGLESLIKVFPVKHYLARREDVRDRRLRELRLKALVQGAETLELTAGKTLRIGDVEVTPIHPDPEFFRRAKPGSRRRVDNEFSLVLRIEYRKFSMLLTGDIGEQAERYLVERGAPLRADFLAAPHHGSRRSNTPAFVQAVSPRAALFSSGRLNPFHHPDPEVVERYKAAGAQIWRTDVNGAIAITTDGTDHRVQGHEAL